MEPQFPNKRRRFHGAQLGGEEGFEVAGVVLAQERRPMS